MGENFHLSSARAFYKEVGERMAKSIPTRNIRLKRAYEKPAASDGLRILVDRLWPRGLSKRAAAIDEWNKRIAPTPALRTWFGHDPERWAEFCRRYTTELRAHAEEIEQLRALSRKGTITLVTAARDEAHTHALVLRKALLAGGAKRKPKAKAG
jgi:uncharacterized protein YeaO (DUF488 family)